LDSPTFYLGGEAARSEPGVTTQMSEIALPPAAVVIEHVGISKNRGSAYTIGSVASSHSDGSNCVNLTPESAFRAVIEPATSVSVRPLSPYESMSFPQPPVNYQASPGDKRDPFSGQIITIITPYSPSMPDELAVVSGDTVRIVKTFDDGWALVEKSENIGYTVTGLIPLDCLRGQ